MREGLIPSRPTHVMRLPTDMKSALALAGRLGEMLDADENAVAAFESADETHWLVEVFFSAEPDEAQVRSLIAAASGEALASAARFEHIAPKDWIAASLDGLKPVRAGRFVVHGSHDRAAVRPTRSASRWRRPSPSARATTAPRVAACCCWRAS